jgi:hypothetical protein
MELGRFLPRIPGEDRVSAALRVTRVAGRPCERPVRGGGSPASRVRTPSVALVRRHERRQASTNARARTQQFMVFTRNGTPACRKLSECMSAIDRAITTFRQNRRQILSCRATYSILAFLGDLGVLGLQVVTCLPSGAVQLSHIGGASCLMSRRVASTMSDLR